MNTQANIKERMTAKVDRITAMLKNMVDFAEGDFEAGLDKIAESVEQSLLGVWRENTSLPCDCFFNLTIIKGETDGEYLSCSPEKCDTCGDCCGECGKNGREDDSDDESESDDDSSVSSYDSTVLCDRCEEYPAMVSKWDWCHECWIQHSCISDDCEEKCVCLPRKEKRER